MSNYFIGLSLGAASSIESGIAVLQENGELCYVDKLFSVNDVVFFFDNFSSLKQSSILVSLPWDNAMLNGKWRVLSKPYQLIHENNLFLNKDNWMQRFSPRGSDYLLKLSEEGIDIKRFEIYLTRQKLNLYSNYKERSPADCKFFQSELKLKYGFVKNKFKPLLPDLSAKSNLLSGLIRMMSFSKILNLSSAIT